MTLLLALLLTTAHAMANLAEGTITGTSNLVKTSLLDPNIMAFIVQYDPTTKINYAILAEYDRKSFAHFATLPVFGLPLGSRGSYLTSWVNRMYLYQVDRLTSTQYELKTLKVAADGEIEVDKDIKASLLTLKNANTLKGAVIQRFEGSSTVSETIQLNNKRPANSTWENLVPGRYFGTNNNTGGDYFKKDVNTNLDDEGLLLVDRSEIKGAFQLEEKKPKMFTVTSLNSNNLGAEKITNRIAVFIDIVNWKELGIERFTTEELMIINPQNAKDVGFYYERQ